MAFERALKGDLAMDLHDYKDVAENYDRYVEAMFGHDDSHAGFLDFYLELARKYGSGGVVDIACGTGAVLLYLAEHGIDVDGSIRRDVQSGGKKG